MQTKQSFSNNKKEIEELKNQIIKDRLRHLFYLHQKEVAKILIYLIRKSKNV